jgi:exopolyphosphatase/pppGpp-phosphohydrolase
MNQVEAHARGLVQQSGVAESISQFDAAGSPRVLACGGTITTAAGALLGGQEYDQAAVYNFVMSRAQLRDVASTFGTDEGQER